MNVNIVAGSSSLKSANELSCLVLGICEQHGTVSVPSMQTM